MENWEEQDYIKYLKEADKWFKDRFKNLECLGSIIHMDESKPHLHISFSYFSPKEGAWIQKKLNQQGLTNFNNIYRDFEKEVGKRFGLKKGLNMEQKERALKKSAEKFLKSSAVEKGLIFKKKFIEFNVAKKHITKILAKTYSARKKERNLIGIMNKLKARERKKDEELNTLKRDYELLEKQARKIYWEERNKVEKLKMELQEKDKLLNQKNNIIKEKDREIRELKHQMYKKNVKRKDIGIGF